MYRTQGGGGGGGGGGVGEETKLLVCSGESVFVRVYVSGDFTSYEFSSVRFSLIFFFSSSLRQLLNGFYCELISDEC